MGGANPLENLPSKSVWKERVSGAWSFLCLNCSRKRQVSLHPEPWRPINFFRVGITTSIFVALFWPVMGLKGIAMFVPAWVIFEVAYRLKVRGSMSCPHCGFDPYLYRIDVSRARSEIDRFWRQEYVRKGIPYPSEEASPVEGPDEGRDSLPQEPSETQIDVNRSP